MKGHSLTEMEPEGSWRPFLSFIGVGDLLDNNLLSASCAENPRAASCLSPPQCQGRLSGMQLLLSHPCSCKQPLTLVPLVIPIKTRWYFGLSWLSFVRWGDIGVCVCVVYLLCVCVCVWPKDLHNLLHFVNYFIFRDHSVGLREDNEKIRQDKAENSN